jgi:hypothetical protein
VFGHRAENCIERSYAKGRMVRNNHALMRRNCRFKNDMASDLMDLLIAPLFA